MDKLTQFRADNVAKDIQIAELQAELIDAKAEAAKDVCVCMHVCIRAHIFMHGRMCRV